MVYLNLAVLPNIEIINKFEDFIKPAFLKIYNLKVENQKLAELRDLLLPKLMSGEIRV
jgi:type I restriction enzyme S subunit